MPPALRIVPLGGLGEIGLNCLALEYEDRLLVIDAGLMFPDPATMPGVDLVIPDFSWLRERAGRLSALVLTHGHEDHIGAAGFLLREIGRAVPVAGTRLTLALAREHLREARVEPELLEVEPRQKLVIGPFDLEFIRVNHSILDGVAVALATPWGAVIHTGDFRLDQGGGEDRLDLFKFAEYGEKGVLALLSDSTNADQPGFSDSEITVGRTLERLFREAPGRVILACFASSLARLRQAARAAKAVGRQVVFEGRGMVNIVKLAKSLGYLQDVAQAAASSSDLPDDQLVIVATGSQGEPMSALYRMAHGEHRQIAIRKGDTVIFSARSIPGHEKAITGLIDLFYRQGAQVVDGRASKVHASGHGQAEELKLMLNLTRPRYLVPIHGATRQLIRHGELARELGWPEENIFVLANGRPLRLTEGGAEMEEAVVSGRKLVDGNRLGEPEDPVLQSRLKLAGGGLVVVTVVLTAEGELAVAPRAAIRGVHYENDLDLSMEAAAVAAAAVSAWREEDGGVLDEETLAAAIQREVRQLFRHSISRRPGIWPQIIFLPGPASGPGRVAQA